MADVSGPCSTLPGSYHQPEGMCDDHHDRVSVARIQGETDSFGAEYYDVCQECLDEHRSYLKSDDFAESRKGKCDWCKSQAEDLRDRRDIEEGMGGRVYRVCGACVKEELAIWEEDRSYYDDYDD